MIIRSTTDLKDTYDLLGPNDVFIGDVTGKGYKQILFVDLLERGVACFPSVLSQMLNGSKVAQAVVLHRFMSPHTLPIFRRHDLMKAIGMYNREDINAVITKTDTMDCGHGVTKWPDIETLYSGVSHSDSAYPFVLQPYLESFTDVRVIIVGDYVEAYARKNPDNFRQNISAGGKRLPYEISEEQKAFCLKVMARGKFPFGHIDLQIFDEGKWYLSEIALNGGISGASIQRKDLDKRKQDLLEQMAAEFNKG